MHFFLPGFWCFTGGGGGTACLPDSAANRAWERDNTMLRQTPIMRHVWTFVLLIFFPPLFFICPLHVCAVRSAGEIRAPASERVVYWYTQPVLNFMCAMRERIKSSRFRSLKQSSSDSRIRSSGSTSRAQPGSTRTAAGRWKSRCAADAPESTRFLGCLLTAASMAS